MAIAGFLELHVFGPSGFWTMAPLRCAAKSLSFLGLRPHALHPVAIQGKEGIKFYHLATLDSPKMADLSYAGDTKTMS